MVGSIRPFLLSLTCALAVSAAPASAATDSPSQPKAADQGKSGAAQADRATVFALPGEDPPPPFVPLHPRTVEDRKRIEALTDFSAARALESKHAWTDSIALLEQTLKLAPDSVAVLRRLSRLCFALGRNEQAVKYSKQALAVDPGDTETLGRLISYYAQRKNDPATAEEILQGVLADPKLDTRSPGHLLAEFELGRLYAGKLQNMDKAADALTQVVDALDEKEANRLSPKDQQRILGSEPEEAYLEFGSIFLAAKRFQQAVKAFERGLVYDPEHPQLPLLLAQTLLEQDKPAEALALIERFLKRQPQGNEGYELLAKALTALKREDEITPRLEEAAGVDSKNFPLQYTLADRYRETGQVDKAEALYKKLLAATPTPQGYGALASSLLKRKQTEELLKVIAQALTKPGGFQAVEPQLKTIAEDQSYAEKVIEMGRKLLTAEPPALDRNVGVEILAYIASKPDNADNSSKLAKFLVVQRQTLRWNPSPQNYQKLMLIFNNLHRYDEAASTVEELMAKFPDERNARNFLDLCKLRRLAEQKEAAIAAAREALKLDPRDGESQLQLALLLSQTGKVDESIEIARGALKTDEANPDFNRLLGYILAQHGRNDEAIALYKRLLERYPNHDELVTVARSGLSVVYVNQGEFVKGEAELEKLLERNPDDSGVNNDLGYLYADQGKNLEKAEAMIRKALEERPDDSAYLDSLGWVLFKRGKLKEAVEPLEKAVKNAPAGVDATIHEHLGDVYFRLQQAAKAKAAWQEAEKVAAKTIPPDKRLPEIRKKLKSLEQLGTNPKPSTGETP